MMLTLVVEDILAPEVSALGDSQPYIDIFRASMSAGLVEFMLDPRLWPLEGVTKRT